MQARGQKGSGRISRSGGLSRRCGDTAVPTLPESALRAKIDQAAEAAVSMSPATLKAGTEAPKPLENTLVSMLQDGAGNGIMEAEDWSSAVFQSEKAEARHQRHVSEYGLDSFEDYVQGARELLAAPISEDVEGFRNNAGALYKYRKSANDFAIGRVIDGTAYILTRFRPVDGALYWEGEVARERLQT